MEPTLEQYQQSYISCSTITRQLKWSIRWIEKVLGGEIMSIAQPPTLTLQIDGRVSYGGTEL